MDQTIKISHWRRYVNAVIAVEISALTRYFGCLVQWAAPVMDTKLLLDLIECPEKHSLAEQGELAAFMAAPQRQAAPIALLLNGNLNHDLDIQQTLTTLKKYLKRSDRIILVAYNAYLRWLYILANLVGLRRGEPPRTFVTQTDLDNICRLSGFEIVRTRLVGYCPFRFWGLGNLINRFSPLVPLAKYLSLTQVIVMRPVLSCAQKPSLTIVVPARNERANIEPALQRIPQLPGVNTEVLLVEGHSTDETWEEIQRLLPLYSNRFAIKALKQPGKGKADAVKYAFGQAGNEILVILDADMAVPPEQLEKFYTAYCQGLADFINGSRLVYPRQESAMRFLNLLGNAFFAKALSLTLGTRLGDTLCGTKLLSKQDYLRISRWNKDFGDFDPFGDFELLFPAAQLGLGIIDIPVHYCNRAYGQTNISRFRHGWLLLKMVWAGFWRLKLGRVPA
jgi:hypothetical protein